MGEVIKVELIDAGALLPGRNATYRLKLDAWRIECVLVKGREAVPPDVIWGGVRLVEALHTDARVFRWCMGGHRIMGRPVMLDDELVIRTGPEYAAGSLAGVVVKEYLVKAVGGPDDTFEHQRHDRPASNRPRNPLAHPGRARPGGRAPGDIDERRR
ncbi:MAG: hypothetical protein N2483_02665 [Burkholderiaceae bacterium]|nr:hypothetical protein [Burkholderiaceae bacterium]